MKSTGLATFRPRPALPSRENNIGPSFLNVTAAAPGGSRLSRSRIVARDLITLAYEPPAEAADSLAT